MIICIISGDFMDWKIEINEKVLVWLAKNIKEELSDAEKYFEAWKETDDVRFLTLSKDELRHSEILIKMVRESGCVCGKRLKELITLHDIILAKQI